MVYSIFTYHLFLMEKALFVVSFNVFNGGVRHGTSAPTPKYLKSTAIGAFSSGRTLFNIDETFNLKAVASPSIAGNK